MEGLDRESKGDLLGVVAGGGSEVSDPSPRSIGGVAGKGEWALTLPTSADRGPLAFRLMAFWRLTLPLPGAGDGPLPSLKWSIANQNSAFVSNKSNIVNNNLRWFFPSEHHAALLGRGGGN